MLVLEGVGICNVVKAELSLYFDVIEVESITDAPVGPARDI